MTRNFRELLQKRWDAGYFLCVGLDTHASKIPKCVQGWSTQDTIQSFNRAIVDATKDLVCAYMPNAAYYDAWGDEGLRALRATISYIHDVAPDILVIDDAKRSDTGETNLGYVGRAFDWLGADATTVSPYMGGESLRPFLQQAEKGIFVLCRTSNKGSGEFQNLTVKGLPLHRLVASTASGFWNENSNCGLVMSATYSGELMAVRMAAPTLPLLITGLSEKEEEIGQTVRAAMDSRGQGFLIHAPQRIIFVSEHEDFAKVARREAEKLHTLINSFRCPP